MDDRLAVPTLPSHLTLTLCTILHGFTHAYGTLLVPLYLLIVSDLKLRGVGWASFVVTTYGLVYCLGSYGAGVLADRFDRKWLLGIGLFGNALAIFGMGLVRQYEWLVALGVMGGLFGTLFHPAANALIPAHYPRSPGMAIGLLGIGAGLGFFAGPRFSGWRAETAGWQQPCLEAGIAGMVFAVLFLAVASEVRRRHAAPAVTAPPEDAEEDGMLPNRVAIEAIVTDLRGESIHSPRHLTSRMRRRVVALAAVLGCRDFAGVASLTLASVYLQRAGGYDVRRAGFVLGTMMLISVLANPLSVYLSPGRRRLPALAAVLAAAGVAVAVVPLFPVSWVLGVMCVFQTFQLGSYAMSDAAMLERVPAAIRGRVVGLFLTLAGTFASLSPWLMGYWIDALGERSHEQSAYVPIFATLGALMVVSAFSPPLIARLAETTPQPEAVMV